MFFYAFKYCFIRKHILCKSYYCQLLLGSVMLKSRNRIRIAHPISALSVFQMVSGVFTRFTTHFPLRTRMKPSRHLSSVRHSTAAYMGRIGTAV